MLWRWQVNRLTQLPHLKRTTHDQAPRTTLRTCAAGSSHVLSGSNRNDRLRENPCRTRPSPRGRVWFKNGLLFVYDQISTSTMQSRGGDTCFHFLPRPARVWIRHVQSSQDTWTEYCSCFFLEVLYAICLLHGCILFVRIYLLILE